MHNHLKNELRNIISGKNQVRYGASIQAIASYLINGETTSRSIESEKQFKEQEEKRLVNYITKNGLWISDIDFSNYVSEGAEQKVYLKNSESVFKLNDGIYYKFWVDYFHSLLLHNFFFADTAYKLLGFTYENEVLYAVVQQSYVSITQVTDIENVKLFLKSNGFEIIRNNDYSNKELGIILEDLHDENVLTKDDTLYFIDTVFYLTDDFWK